MKKRLVSFLLALCVVLQAVPLTVFAAENCEHTFDEEYLYGAEEGHYLQCDNCSFWDETSLEEHINDDNDDYCDWCDFEVGHEHTFDNGNCDGVEAGHYYLCDQCGYCDEEYLEDHINDDNDDYCDLCGFQVGHTHTFENDFYQGEEDGHYRVCDQCDYYDEASREDHINEDNDEYCDLCEYEVGHEHTFDDENYYSAEEGHYLVCDQCDYYDEASLEAHVNADEEEEHYCDVCGSTFAENHSYSGIRYSATITGHYVQCDYCTVYDESAIYNHTNANNDDYCDDCGYDFNIISIVLTWDTAYDMDAHMFYTGSFGTVEVYHSNSCLNPNGELIAEMGEDDTDGYGPEIITIYKYQPGDSFKLYVYDLGGEIADSGANVKVYHKNTLFAEYAVPQDSQGNIWEVFSYSDDGIQALEHQYQVTHVDAAQCDGYGYSDYQCINCGNTYRAEDEEPLGHIFDGEYYYGEEEGHYSECDRCNYYEEDSFEAHINEDNDEYCDLCEYEVGHKHTFDDENYYSAEEGHYLVCDQCDYYDEDSLEDHINDDNDDYCDLCDFEVGHEHTFDYQNYYGVEEGHYLVCDQCDYYDEDSLEDHINDDNDDFCDLCDFEVGHEHTFDNGNCDGVEAGHYYLCDQCDYYDEDSLEDHINDDNDDYCDLCDFEVGHEHTFDDENYYSAEEGHYLVCDQCDYYDEASLEAHISADEDEEHWCDICEYCISADHIYSGMFYVGIGAGHYVRCDLCQIYDETILFDHIDLDNDDFCDSCGQYIDFIQIVLTWGADPADLDSHLICAGSGGNAEVAFYSMTHTSPNGELIADLDVDDTTSYGPETVTIYAHQPGDYFRYYVHDYTNRGDAASSALAYSGATVKVYHKGVLLATYFVPTDIQGYIWEVFSYSDDGLSTLEHHYTETRVDAETCGEYGYFEYTCTTCDDCYRVYDENPLEHNYESVVTPPDGENAGYTTHTCSICGDSYDTEYVEPIASWNICLGDNIGINFVLNVGETEEVTFSVNGLDIEATRNGNTYSLHLAAAQMVDEIVIFVNGIALEETYSVRKYGDYILDDANGFSDAEKNLIRAMLNYGGAAQVLFNHNNGVLANDGIAAGNVVPTGDGEVIVKDSLTCIDFYGASLVYRDRTAVRFYFTGNIEGLTFSQGTPVQKGDMYYIEVANINPQQLGDTIEIVVSNGSNSLTVGYSPLNYIVRMYEKADSTAATKALVLALYNYYLAAKAY